MALHCGQMKPPQYQVGRGLDGREGERGVWRERLFQSVIYAFSRIGRCSDWRYFGVLRLLIYDKAGGANPKSWDGCNKALAQFDAAMAMPSLKLPPLLWCQETWKVNGYIHGRLWLPMDGTCNLGGTEKLGKWDDDRHGVVFRRLKSL